MLVITRQVLAVLAIASVLVAVSPRVQAQTPALLSVTGQVLDSSNGFLFLTTGDGFRVDKSAKILDFRTKATTTEKIRPRLFARATFDTSTGTIVSIELSHTALPTETDYTLVHKFAVALSTPAPNPDLGAAPSPGSQPAGFHEALDGKPVIVAFIVQVPPNTPLTSTVYISTDQSGWNPQAVRMDRIDALHYRVIKNLNSGTVFHYRYTRGSQTTVERAQNGLEQPPRFIEVTNLDVKNREDIVYHWSDETLSGQSVNPLAVPTPFNPNPFGNLPPNPNRPRPTPPP